MVHPFFNTVQLEGKLQGIVTSGEGMGGVAIPVEMNVEVRSGHYFWYDKIQEADIKFAKGLYEEAGMLYDVVLGMESLPTVYAPLVLLSAAKSLAARNRAFEARVLVQAAIDRVPKYSTTSTNSEVLVKVDSKLWFYLGVFCGLMGDWSESESAYLQSLELDAKNMDVLSHLSSLLFITGDLERSFHYFLQLVLVQSSEQKMHDAMRFHSSFRVQELHNEMAVWFVDHLMLIFDLHGAPSLLRSNRGEWQANLILIYKGYQNETIPGIHVDRKVVLDRELVHYNLAKRLAVAGAWEESAWHFNHAASFGSEDRKELLQLRSYIQHPMVVAGTGMADIEASQLVGRLAKLQAASSSLNARRMLNCMALSGQLFSRRNELVHVLNEDFLSTLRSVCGGESSLEYHSQHCEADPHGGGGGDRKLRVGVISPDYSRSVTGAMLHPVLGALNSGWADLVLFTWPIHTGPTIGTVRLVNPRSVIQLPKYSLAGARAVIEEQGLDVAIFVDMEQDLRSVLLAQSRLARRQFSLRIMRDNMHLAIPKSMDGAVAVDATACCPDTGKCANTGKVKQVSQAYITLLLDTTRRANPDLAKTKHQYLFQGQYLYDEKNYYYVVGDALQLHPDFDNIIEEILTRDEQGVIVLSVSKATPILTETLWKRIGDRNIDIQRIKVFQEMPSNERAAFVHNMNVALEPFPSLSNNLVAVLEALHMGIPIVSLASQYSSQVYLGLETHLLPQSRSQYVARAVDLARKSHVGNEFRYSVRATLLKTQSHFTIREAEQTLAQAWKELLLKR